jgi:hypothetical protein
VTSLGRPQDLSRNVRTLLALVRCPTCGHHDAALAARNARTRPVAIVATAAISVAVIAVMCLCAYFDPADGLRWLFIAMVPALAAIAISACSFAWARYPSETGALVELVDPARRRVVALPR